MIEVKNLTKKYENNIAVDNLSFAIDKGKIYGFLGPNGAGKSTTMNIITGYIAATEGEVSINGFDIIKESRKAKACIGYLPEIPPLYQDMTVNEYLNFAAELKGIKKSERGNSVAEAEETMRISDVSGRLIKNLSKGYKQRVGLAQAIIGLPEILILDEPTAGLDPKQIIEIRDLIKELGEKHTIIMSSHILSEVSAVCDHIMIISKGRLVASDTAENLTKMMQPEVRLDVTVRTDTKTAGEILAQVENVSEYSVSESQEQGASDAEVRYKPEFDLRDEIFRAFTEKGCSIIKMNTAAASLEDVFMELTEGDAELYGGEEAKPQDETEGDQDDGSAADIEADSESETADGTVIDMAGRKSGAEYTEIHTEAAEAYDKSDGSESEAVSGKYEETDKEEDDGGNI